jgi:flagellar assembly protein FliH
MSSVIIPKEHLTAFQRWEMASFDANEEDVETRLASADEALAKIHETARVSGYAEGYSAGLSESRAAMDGQRQAMSDLMRGITDELTNASHAFASDVLDLALDLAKAMLRQALAVNPERILPVVRETLASLPGVNQPALLFLHPDDAELVSRIMGTELTTAGWSVRRDGELERGGCRIETATSEVDASNPQRWQKITRALGKDSEWQA